MRFLLSTIGSRGDVQPLLELGTALRESGHAVRLCVPPDFQAWAEALGFEVAAIGPEVRDTARGGGAASPTTSEHRARLLEGTVAAQFEAIPAAAEGCDVIVGATALQVAAPSVAEKMGIPYVFVAFCPAVLPSARHAPPVITPGGERAAGADLRSLWQEDAVRWNGMWGSLINSHRASLGLAPVADIRGYVHTPTPWLAADPTLAPWHGGDDRSVIQTGAWMLPDVRPLDREVASFLDAGDPPVYFGLGSIRVPAGLPGAMVESARALGLRMILSRGWAELTPIDAGDDCLSIGDVNHHALFRRVAAVVHHGGAGTTTAAALAGTPQVILPQIYDQFYWAGRVEELGIGIAHGMSTPSSDSLAGALRLALARDIVEGARRMRLLIREDGARKAAERLCRLRPL